MDLITFLITVNYGIKRVRKSMDVHQTQSARTFSERCPREGLIYYLKMSAKKNQPKEQVKNEFKAVLNRWFEESDLDVEELSACGVEAIEEWLDEDTIEFTPE